MGGPYIPREGDSHPAGTNALSDQVQPPAEPVVNEPAEQVVSEPAPVNEEYIAPHVETEHVPENVEQAPAPYTMDSTFKVHDKTYEFDDRIKGHIADKESENYFRELHERAYGLDHVKEDRSLLRTENNRLKQFETEYSPVKKDLDYAMQRLKGGDFESFKDMFGVTDDVIFNYARTKAVLADPEADPAARVAYEQNRMQANQNYQLQIQNNELSQNVSSTQTTAMSDRINATINSQEYSQMANDWDSRAGRQGAFRDEITTRGKLHHMQTGQDIMPEQIVANMASNYGHQPAAPRQGLPPLTQHVPQTYGSPLPQPQPYQQNGFAPQPQMMAPQVQQPMVMPTPGRPPVIPNIQGSGTSPVKQAPRSIDDIRRLANEANM